MVAEREMTLQERLRDDLKEAMRQRDETRVSTVRLLLSAIRNEEIAREVPKNGLDDAGVLAVAAREAKQRRESIEEFHKGQRPDLVAKEEAELAVLQGYLPQQLSREEIAAAARRIIEQTGAKTPQDVGKVMPRIMAELRGRADGREVSAIVSDLLRR